MKVELKANLQPKPTKWTEVEIQFLLKYYPRYKENDLRITTGVLRGHLQNRTMSAISKKYWSIMGCEHKEKIELNQLEFSFKRQQLL